MLLKVFIISLLVRFCMADVFSLYLRNNFNFEKLLWYICFEKSVFLSIFLPIPRSYRQGSLKVDDSEPVNGTSAEGSLGLNIKGPILIGEYWKAKLTSLTQSLKCNTTCDACISSRPGFVSIIIGTRSEK